MCVQDVCERKAKHMTRASERERVSNRIGKAIGISSHFQRVASSKVFLFLFSLTAQCQLINFLFFVG